MPVARTPRMQFEIDWRDTVDGIECKTVASITLLADGTPIWPIKGEDSDEFEWFADELLAHLTECWKPLLLRQNYPISIQPERPSSLLSEAEKRWSGLPDATVKDEQREVAAFEDIHNLANAFGGIGGLLPLWLLRDQDKMIVDTQELFLQIPIHEAISALSSAGNIIADRLKLADGQKWEKLLRAWHQRNHGDATLVLALTIGRDRASAATLITERVLEAPKSFDEAVNDDDELRIAARMAGPMPLNQIRSVIEKVRTCELRNAPKLQEIVAEATYFLETNELTDSRPHVQGDALAIWLRRTLRLSANRAVDPFQVLDRHFNIDVRIIDFGIPSLDAIAVWGKRYGPCVLLNSTSRRIRHSSNIWRNGALRVTAAHELCHFLLDSNHTLSAVEILGGRMPLRIEQRAKAFAAEFLLPSKDAGDVWREEGYPLDLESLNRIIRMLCHRYNVTKSVAAWQLEHGASEANREELDQVLNQLVPQR
jgi:Zn-dependent peptidase ImmA (M78 family)